MQKLLKRPVTAKLMEDNAACIVAIKKGFSPSMRHLQRTMRISLGSLHEAITCEEEPEDGEVQLCKAASEVHKGDLFTKEMDGPRFEKALGLIKMTSTPPDTTSE